MNALGLRFPVCSVGGGIHVPPQNIGKHERDLSRVTSLRGLELPRGRRISHKRSKTISAIDSSDRNGTAAQQAVLDKEPEVASESQKFNWTTQWYPVAVIKDLDENAPTPATILGRPLAIWWDRSISKWQVYADQCPHRLAPLSEGSISEEGHLRCSYHGWTFKGDSGECTFIPQAPKDGPPAHTSKRACVAVYPSMVQQGILWYWPDLSQGPINMQAAANPPPVFAEFEDPTFKYDLSARDLEYGYETLIENLMDPAHVNFAHHKIQGNRNQAKPLNYVITTDIAPTGFRGEDERSKAAFYAPCSFTLSFAIPATADHIPGTGVKYKSKEGDTEAKSVEEKPPKKISLILLCIPISPGRSRLIWSFPRNFATFLFKVIPPWVGHMTNNLVLDSDLYLLHVMERNLEHVGASKWNNRYYLPTKADAYVKGFRKWLNTLAGGAPDWGGRFENRLPPSPPKRLMMDRYSQHVVQCKSCRNASKNMKALEVGLQVLAIALVGLVAASAILPIRPVQSLAVPLVIVAVLSTILSKWLANFIHKTFHFHDYNHAVVK